MYPDSLLKTGKKAQNHIQSKHHGFPCKTCEIDAQISRVRHGNDRKGNVSRPCALFFLPLANYSGYVLASLLFE